MAISDDELRGRLTALGCDVGPIDDTTRPLYVAMLKRCALVSLYANTAERRAINAYRNIVAYRQIPTIGS